MKTATKKTPVEYNGGQLDKVLKTPFREASQTRYVVGCDWLELSLKGDLSFMCNSDKYEKSGFTLVAAGVRSKFYRCSHNVYLGGELFGLILHQTRENSVIPVESVNFKLDNQQLYKRKDIDLKIRKFLEAFELTFSNYTRVDLCIDFTRFNDNLSFQEFVATYGDGQIESKGKVQNFDKYYTRINGEMTLTGFSYGSRSSDKFIRCYDKTVELTKRHKPYIQKWWLANGFKEGERVYRFEIQLNSKFFRKTKGFRLKLDGRNAWELSSKQFSISSVDSILALLQTSLLNYFDFFEREQKARNDSKTPFEVFDWVKLRDGVKRVYSYIREKIVHKAVTWRQKMIVVRNMFREYVVNFQDDQWLFFVARIVHDYELGARWQKAKERYTLEFLNSLGELYLFDWKKLESSFNSFMLQFKSEGRAGKLSRLASIGTQTELLPMLTASGHYSLTQKPL